MGNPGTTKNDPPMFIPDLLANSELRSVIRAPMIKVNEIVFSKRFILSPFDC
jgi:hypothetical protein